MKKWLTGILIAFVILLGSLYLFIPNTISLQRMLTIDANAQASFRTLLDSKAWEKWWPGEKKMKNGRLHFFYNGYFYSVIDQKINALVIAVSNEKVQATTVLNFFSDNQGTVVLFWEGAVPASLMPLSRIQTYLKVRSLRSDLGVVLQKMGSYLSKPEKIYSIPITEEIVVDSILVSTFASSSNYPTTEFIYGLIGQLRDYTKKQDAKETGFPMLNITKTDSANYVTRVALPVNKIVKSSGNISYKWMLGGGKILVAEVTGGPAAIDQACRELEFYISDNKRVAPAISFQALVTDRSTQTDTSKWITKIYYPVM